MLREPSGDVCPIVTYVTLQLGEAPEYTADDLPLILCGVLVIPDITLKGYLLGAPDGRDGFLIGFKKLRELKLPVDFVGLPVLSDACHVCVSYVWLLAQRGIGFGWAHVLLHPTSQVFHCIATRRSPCNR